MSGQNGVNFTKGSRVKIVALDHVLYKDDTCSTMIYNTKTTADCVMQQHPLLSLTVNTYGNHIS